MQVLWIDRLRHASSLTKVDQIRLRLASGSVLTKGCTDMAKFLTIGYGDRAGYDRTAPEVRAAAHDHDERLRSEGAVMGIARPPVQVRNHASAAVSTIAGPFMTSDLPVAGFALIDADSLEAAVELVSETPCAVAYGVVEVWPFEQ